MIVSIAHLLGALFTLLYACDAYNTKGQTYNSGRVVGGRDTNQKYFPYLVSIQHMSKSGDHWSHTCGGSIVTPTCILTACHCVAYTNTKPLKYKDTANYRIVAGVTNWKSNDSERQEVGVKQYIAHRRCNRGGYFRPHTYYDVALIELQSPLKYSPRVQPLKLFSRDLGKAVGELRHLQEQHTLCYSPGWGRIQQIPKIVRSPELKVARQTLHTARECHGLLCHGRSNASSEGKCSDLNKIEQVCVVSEDASVCNGDSGGPLVCNGFVFGVVSQVGRTCQFGGMQIYSGIKSILNIINKYVPKSSDRRLTQSVRRNVK